MNTTTASVPVHQLTGYTFVEPIYQGTRTTVYRAVEIATQQSVVIKFLAQEYPSFAELVQFRNQYTVTKNLPFSGIVQPLSLESWGNCYALVMEDFEGIDLGQYTQQFSLSLAEILDIAIQLAGILHELHQHRVIHKDIKPANILIHPDSKQVKLIDFSIASLLPKETQTIQNPQNLEGTLAYMAPEQTGRMNRGIDYRTDFYALGVTLYQLLTNQLPFISNDPLELIHCHIARLPMAVNLVNSEVPTIVAEIVAKLIAKNSEDRYQSARGLKYDLEKCLAQWKEQGEIVEFNLGQRDLSDRFLIAEKLYGRETEVQALLDAFDQVAQGVPKLMLVAGFSGIGKTAVVNEIHKPIVRQRGYFIKGKFDQFNRNIPFSAFVQSFRDLVRQLLSESDAELNTWKTQILEALGENVQVLIDLIPELETILGTQPPAPELSGNAAQNRFNLLFGKFIRVFTVKEHPLVIFLDDLQWIDSASLNLLNLLMSESGVNADTGYLLVLGAYRDNEVSSAHPLMLTLTEMEKQGALPNTITLKPLTETHITQLVADTLLCSPKIAEPLSKLVYQKTKGNPFFSIQFLQGLHAERCIVFDATVGYWQSDLSQVRQLALTDNVVVFMMERLRKLSKATQDVLKIAACVGNQFDLATLAIVCEHPQEDVAVNLWQALQDGLVVPESETYKFFQGHHQNGQSADKSAYDITINYRFLHDRVQQAAYSLIAEAQKRETHLKIGQLLLRNISKIQREASLFEITNQLNYAVELISEPAQRWELVQLNVDAAFKAKASTAYEAAQQYVEVAISLLPIRCWQDDYLLIKSLYELATEIAFLQGNFEQMESFAQEVLSNTKTGLEQVKVHEIKIQAYAAQYQLKKSIQVGREILTQLGVHIPENPTEDDFFQEQKLVADKLAQRSIQELATLPLTNSPQVNACFNILARMSIPAAQHNPHLLALISVKQVNLTLDYGNTDTSPFAFASYGTILCVEGKETAEGYQFGQLALSLLDANPSPIIVSKTLFYCYLFITHWRDSLHHTLQPMIEAYQLSLSGGDLETATACAQVYCAHAYFCGLPLDELISEMENYGQVMQQLKQKHNLNSHQIYHQAVVNLREKVENPCELAGEIYNPRGKSEHIFIFEANLHELILSCLFSKYDRATSLGEQLKANLCHMISLIYHPLTYFYDALAQLQRCHAAEEATAASTVAAIKLNREKLYKWGCEAPMNHRHKYQLVEADTCRVLGQKLEAIEMYDCAIAGAKANNYLQEEALANELAAKFYLGWGKEKIAAVYMQEAYYCYSRWGAKAKVTDLEICYPELLGPILQSSASSEDILNTIMTLTAPINLTHADTHHSPNGTGLNQTLDFVSILKASQALSSIIQLDELLCQLTQIILKNSGGDSCSILLPDARGEWQVRAIATSKDTHLYTEPLINNPNVPVKLIQYVKNTEETIVINDLKTDLPVIDDYLREHEPKSVLCLPLLNQGHLIGILYLKNHLTSSVFTKDRILVVRFLCTQAAISLRNAYLYELQQRKSIQLKLSEQRHKAIFEKAADAILLLSKSGFIDCNQSCVDLFELAGREAVISVHPAQISPEFQPDGQSSFKKANIMMQTAYEKGRHKFEWLHQRCNGEVFWAEVMLTPIVYTDDSGEIIDCLHAIVRDISRRKRAEDAILQKNQVLEKTLTELETMQLQLVQHEKMATLGNLVAGVAHEVNNPIGFLNGSVGNAKDYVQDLFEYLEIYHQQQPPTKAVKQLAEDVDLAFLIEDFPKLLNSMQTAADRITDISTSLRIFSRADTTKKVSVNIDEGLDSTLLILKYRLKANEYRPTIEVLKHYGNLSEVNCFPAQLNQVFMNILANAIDMFDEMAQQSTFEDLEKTPQTITIKTANVDEHVEIRISDNGTGMTDKVKSKIFDHLFTTKAIGKGTGLGLAIAHQIIVDTHGGSLDVQAKVDQGTEFCIRLPL